MNLSLRLVSAVSIAGALLAPSLAAAQAYPTKPIKLIVPWPAGGATDTAARALAEGMRKDLGQPILVENKPGATGRIGIEAARHAAADGYTLVLANSNSHGIAPALDPKLPYDPIRDFTPVGVAAYGPLALAVRSSLPAKTVHELVDYARRNPGKLNFASAGPGSGSHLLGEMLKVMGGVDIVHVPYKGTAPAVTDLAAGHVDMIFEGQAIKSYVEDGKLRVLATTGARRWSMFPDAPTTAEAGFPKLQSSSWFGIMGPKAMPEPIVARLNRSMVAALKDPVVQTTLKNQGIDPATSTSPVEMKSFIASEGERWKKLLKQANYTHSAN